LETAFMKRLQRLIIMVLLIGLTIPFASAQFYLGVRGGINLASMSTNIAGAENSSIMGIHGGVTTRLQLMKRLSIGGDALFNTFGNKESVVLVAGNTNTTTETTTSISYALVPIYAAYEIPLTPKQLVPYRVKESFVSAHLYGGGYFGYALGATAESNVTILYGDGTPTEVVSTPSASMESDTYNPIDFGIMAGAGISFRLDDAKRQRVYLDFRYFMGMSNFDKREGVTATNNAMAISLAYSYKLTKRLYTSRKKR
jgi:Outer membrane protein beta-barrel domain